MKTNLRFLTLIASMLSLNAFAADQQHEGAGSVPSEAASAHSEAQPNGGDASAIAVPNEAPATIPSEGSATTPEATPSAPEASEEKKEAPKSHSKKRKHAKRDKKCRAACSPQTIAGIEEKVRYQNTLNCITTAPSSVDAVANANTETPSEAPLMGMPEQDVSQGGLQVTTKSQEGKK